LESKDLASLALYSVAFAMAVAVFVLNIIGTFTVSQLVIFLGIGVFAISVAGISSTNKKK
jgi:hypothetical protein